MKAWWSQARINLLAKTIKCGGILLGEIVGGTFMTNVMALVHADTHRRGINEWICQTEQRDGRLHIQYHSECIQYVQFHHFLSGFRQKTYSGSLSFCLENTVWSFDAGTQDTWYHISISPLSLSSSLNFNFVFVSSFSSERPKACYQSTVEAKTGVNRQ